MVGVQLLPDGLVLAKPAVLTVQLPQGLVAAGFVVLHQSGGFVEFVDGDIVQVDDELTFDTLIAHFSTVSFYAAEFVDLSVVLDPLPVFVGQSQAVSIVAVPRIKTSIWIKVEGDDDAEGTYREFDFSAPVVHAAPVGSYNNVRFTVRPGIASPSIRGLSDSWDPPLHTRVGMVPIADAFIGEVSSHCVWRNDDWVTTRIVFGS